MKSASHIDERSESAPTGLNEPCTNGRPLRDRDISGSDQWGRMNSKAPLFNRSSLSRRQMVRGSNKRVWILLVVTSAVLTRLWFIIGTAVRRRMLPSVVADHKLQTGSTLKSRLSTDLTIVPVSNRVVTPPPTNPNGPPSNSGEWSLAFNGQFGGTTLNSSHQRCTSLRTSLNWQLRLQTGRAGISLDYGDRLCPRLGALMTMPQRGPMSHQEDSCTLGPPFDYGSAQVIVHKSRPTHDPLTPSTILRSAEGEIHAHTRNRRRRIYRFHARRYLTDARSQRGHY